MCGAYVSGPVSVYVEHMFLVLYQCMWSIIRGFPTRMVYLKHDI